MSSVRQVGQKAIHRRLWNVKTPTKTPRLWNSLPVDVQSAPSLTTFRQKLWTVQSVKWSTVSKAEHKSNRTTAVTSMLSTARTRSWYMQSIAVSVEWPRWYDDCQVRDKLSSACRMNLDSMRSTTLQVTKRFDIDLQDVKRSGSTVLVVQCSAQSTLILVPLVCHFYSPTNNLGLSLSWTSQLTRSPHPHILPITDISRYQISTLLDTWWSRAS